MVPLPKPRGFWDYALFALMMTGVLVLLFQLEASGGVGWVDAALAFTVAALFVFATILGRQREKAKWIAHPTWHVYVLARFAAFVLIFGAICADAFLFHRSDITSSRLRRDTVVAISVAIGLLWSSWRRIHAERQSL
jgi:hypothetical protein